MAWAKLCIVSMFFMVQYGEAQIPSQCVVSLSTGSTNERKCCPNAVVNRENLGECGGRGRGICTKLNITRQINNTYDPREVWPIKYFTHVCICTDDYGGVDCGTCAYGRYPHPTCEKMLVAKRRNLKHYSPENWKEYIETIKMTRNYDSGYKAIVNGDTFLQGSSSIEFEKRDITLYKFFVWLHYLVAKDSENKTQKLDFAHEGTGFLTWHRQMLLWLEWKIQEMLRENNDTEYHKFRLPFWDWTNETERMKYFTNDRLGESLYESQSEPHVTTKLNGTLFVSDDGSEWQTICWNKEGPDGSNCDPNNETGLLLRCPKRNGTEHSDPCNETAYWPTTKDVWDAVEELSIYDAKDSNGKYSACPTEDNFRSNLEGFKLPANGMCDVDDLMCSDPDPDCPTPDCSRSRRLHNSVHIILGVADIKGLNDTDEKLYINSSERGVMSHVAASPNDPIFINHHAMIDCIFEQWLKNNRQATYPNDVGKDGHRRDDYIVPFIPVFSHKDMFKTADNFGYSCDLSDIVNSGGGNNGGGGGNNNGGGGGNNSGEVARPLVFTIIYLIGVVAAALM